MEEKYIEMLEVLGIAAIKAIVKEAFELLGMKRKKREGEKMDEQEAYETLLESVSSYYRAIGNPKRLKILFELRENFIEGMKWPQLRELVNLSSSALKSHIDFLMEVGLVAKTKSNYRISRSGLGLLTQVDEVMETIEELLKAKKAEA